LALINYVLTRAGITLETFTAQEWYGIIAKYVLATTKLRADIIISVGNETFVGGAIIFLILKS
jgi:hypothetical protein